jgi:hypothetical protein
MRTLLKRRMVGLVAIGTVAITATLLLGYIDFKQGINLLEETTNTNSTASWLNANPQKMQIVDEMLDVAFNKYIPLFSKNYND